MEPDLGQMHERKCQKDTDQGSRQCSPRGGHQDREEQSPGAELSWAPFTVLSKGNSGPGVNAAHRAHWLFTGCLSVPEIDAS